MYKLDLSKVDKVKNVHFEWAKLKAKNTIRGYLSDTKISPLESEFYALLYKDDDTTPLFKDLILGEPQVLRRLIKELETKHEDYVSALNAHRVVSKKTNNFDDYVDEDGKWKLLGNEFDKVDDFKKEIKAIHQRLKRVFSYDSLIRKKTVSEELDTKNWSGYQFAYHLGARVCVYCNRNYTVTLKVGKDGVVRPQLDHFYPKSMYPYLAISLYNLVPSCSTCNANLKLDKDMLDENHEDIYLHPYEDAICSEFRFDFKVERDIAVTKHFSTIGPEDLSVSILGLDANDKYQKSADLFKLKELYELHKEEFSDIYNIVCAYSDSVFDEIESSFEFDKEKMRKEFISNFRTASPEKRSLGKATNDLLDSMEKMHMV